MANKQRVGLHVSAAGGAQNAPENAKEFDAECFQFFSRSPRGGGAPEITDAQAVEFRAKSKEYDLSSYIHTPYYINFASKNNKIYHGSINVVREELERGTKLGVKYVMTHMGSAKDHITKKGETDVPQTAIKQAIDGLKKIYETKVDLTTELLLEISAGAGAVLGDSFEELAMLLDGVGRDDIHICWDTCHLFASGYDISSKAGLDAVIQQFDTAIGLKHLKLIHVNDSKAGLGEHKDRHEHIGHGKIGEAGMKALLEHPKLQNINLILETEHDDLIHHDIAFLKKHRPQHRN